MKSDSFIKKLCYFFICIVLTACAGDKKQNTEKEISETPTSKTTVETPSTDRNYFAWVDNINIRDAANTKGNVIGTYSSKDTLTFTGTTSNDREVIVLRGVAYDDYWLNVKTKDGKQGWVYGGVVKQKGQHKGNEIMTDTKFNFPHFGNFNVTTWSDLGIERSESGDAETTTYSYLKDGKILEIEKTDIGEYGYHNTYRLFNSKRKLLKERTFTFSVEDEDDISLMDLEETVKDYTTNKVYTRSQIVNKHFMQMNAKPQMAYGTWNEATLTSKDGDLTSTVVDEHPDVSFAKPMEIITSVTDLPNGFDNGCDCSFRTHPKNYDTMILLGTYEDAPEAKAVIKIDGKYVILQSKTPENPDHKNGDVHKHYYNNTYDLKLTLTQEGQDDGGGSIYSGTMHLTSKDGKINTHINTFGSCGC